MKNRQAWQTKLTSREFKTIFVAILTVLISAAWSLADTRYVSDQLIVLLREGQGTGDKLAALRTDDPLEVIEEAGEYVKVRTANGIEGYVPGQYISSQTPKSTVIKALNQEIVRLKEEFSSLSSNKEALIDEFNHSSQDYDQLNQELEAFKQEHALKVAELEKQAEDEKSERLRLEQKLRQVSEKNRVLLEQARQTAQASQASDANPNRFQAAGQQLVGDPLRSREKLLWFISGGGVFLFGWIAGKLSRKKKYFSS